MGFSYKRSKKRLVKANESKRKAFVAEYAALGEEAQLTGAKVFLVDEAHFRADAELRGKWVLRGEGQLLFGGVLGDGEAETVLLGASAAGTADAGGFAHLFSMPIRCAESTSRRAGPLAWELYPMLAKVRKSANLRIFC